MRELSSRQLCCTAGTSPPHFGGFLALQAPRGTRGQPLPCVASPSRMAPTQPRARGRLGRGRCAGWEMEAFF